jgi:hypothetical protein
MNRTITLAQLENANVCSVYTEKFRELFGNSTEVTVELCVRHAQDFDWNWAADNLLTATARRAYDDATATALKAHDDAMATARRAYEDAMATALEAYEDAMATALEAYEGATAPASRAYEGATAPASRVYYDALATAWATAYLGDQ